MSADIDKWDARYRQARESLPSKVLLDNRHLLPVSGTALDVACGLGTNALLLAEHGLTTHAWDSSSVAIDKLQQRAQAHGVLVEAAVRDVVAHPPGLESFDVIVVTRFLDRGLSPQLTQALRVDGLLFYQTFTRTRVSDVGPSNPDYRLADGELLVMFSALQVLVYREEGKVGDVGRGFRDEAMMVARKRTS
ncbi:MAG: class I SAM-dependent methyltransferase [Gammaproteobacteria bacterium]|jgi:2-polyprenyl-3-methyl-5-hydroxy-6-metoxy-1,4-benzoquinol methylase|nr:class I SAM-dependent methyltransferase [Gammaproteobacteria bacterium]